MLSERIPTPLPFAKFLNVEFFIQSCQIETFQEEFTRGAGTHGQIMFRLVQAKQTPQTFCVAPWFHSPYKEFMGLL